MQSAEMEVVVRKGNQCNHDLKIRALCVLSPALFPSLQTLGVTLVCTRTAASHSIYSTLNLASMMEQAAFLQVIPRINFLVIPALCPLLAQLPSPKYYMVIPQRLSPRLFFSSQTLVSLWMMSTISVTSLTSFGR